MGTEVYLLDDATHEALDLGRAYWLAEALIPVREALDPHDPGDWEFVVSPDLPSASVIDVVRSFEADAGEVSTKSGPSRELVALLVAWLAARDVVRLASEWTFEGPRSIGWKITGWATVRPLGVTPSATEGR